MLGNILLNAGIGAGLGSLAGGKKGAILGGLTGGIVSGFGQGFNFFDDAKIPEGVETYKDAGGVLRYGGDATDPNFGKQVNQGIGGMFKNVGDNISGMFDSKSLSKGVGSMFSSAKDGSMSGGQFLLGKGIEAGVGIYGQQQQQKILEGQLELQRRQQAIWESEAEQSKQARASLGKYMSGSKSSKQTRNTSTYSGVGLTPLYK